MTKKQGSMGLLRWWFVCLAFHQIFFVNAAVSLTSFSEGTTTTSTTVSSSLSPAASTRATPEREAPPPNLPILPPPIVYTVAGSDSGGGAGIQADLHAIQRMGCHGCSAITCLTAQNSVGVRSIHVPPTKFLRDQLDALTEDLPPRSVKIGMLGTVAVAEEVGRFLTKLGEGTTTTQEPPFVVLDPVMVSTSGAKLIDDDAVEAVVKHVFPRVDLLTPNKFEAERLLGRKIVTREDIEQGARDLLNMGLKAVLMKGGHNMDPSSSEESKEEYSDDYFLSSTNDGKDQCDRLCDGSLGVWIRSIRYDSIHTHGTGCTLSSAIASSMAIGHQQREFRDGHHDHVCSGADMAIDGVDACILAKAYVSAGIAKGVQIGQGAGPVGHTEFPSSYEHFPSVARSNFRRNGFLPMARWGKTTPTTSTVLGSILPIVDTVEWVDRLSRVEGITDVQLRVKNAKDEDEVESTVRRAQSICEAAGIRLWVNDHWRAALACGCFGVHMGQEDLSSCVLDSDLNGGGLRAMEEAGMALGLSTHTYGELSVALGTIRPSYVSLGPVYATSSKSVRFGPQGLSTVRRWRSLVPKDVPLVAIGGIDGGSVASEVRRAGADCVAVIGAVTKAENVDVAVQKLLEAMDGED